MQNHDEEEEEPIKDAEARKHLQVLSSRLYDLKERFVKIVHKINGDLTDYTGQLSSDEDSSINDEPTNEEPENEADSASSVDEDNAGKQKCLIECILRSKARRDEYLNYVTDYPQIMEYLTNDKPEDTNIPVEYIKPFIQNHIGKNLNAQTYDKVIKQMKDIRQNYSNTSLN